jgi:hypothetical protein
LSHDDTVDPRRGTALDTAPCKEISVNTSSTDRRSNDLEIFQEAESEPQTLPISSRHYLCSRWVTLGVPLLLSLASLLYAAWLGVRWDTNDDPMMKAIADGSLSGDPSYRVPFSEELLGLLLRLLYEIAPTVGWYGVHLTTIVVASTTFIAYLTLHVANQRRFEAVLVTLALVPLSAIPILVFHQFTLASGIASAAGLLALTVHTNQRWHMLAAGMFLTTGYLIRAEMLFAACAIAAPLILLSIAQRLVHMSHSPGDTSTTFARSTWQATSNERLALGVFTFGVALNVLAEQILRRVDPTFMAWQEFNGVRGQFHGTKLIADPKVADLSATELEMFNSWSFWDREVFTTEAVQQAVDTAARPANLFPIRDPKPVMNAIWLNEDARQAVVTLILIGIAAGFTCLWSSRDRKSATAFSCALVLTYVAFTYLTATARLPYRVSFGILALLVWYPPLHLLNDGLPTTPSAPPSHLNRQGFRRRLGRGFLAIASGVVILLTVQRTSSWRINPGPNALDIKAEFYTAGYEQDGHVYVLQGPGGLPTQAQSPWRRRAILPPNVIPLGWVVQHPDWEQRVAQLDIENIGLAIADDPEVILDSFKILLFDDTTAAFLKEHYGAGTVKVPAQEIPWANFRMTKQLVQGDYSGNHLRITDFSGTTSRYRIDDVPLPCGTMCDEQASIPWDSPCDGLVYIFQPDKALHRIVRPIESNQRCYLLSEGPTAEEAAFYVADSSAHVLLHTSEPCESVTAEATMGSTLNRTLGCG